MAPDEPTVQLGGPTQLPIEWCYPDDLISRYATNMVVQYTEHEYTISFFEVRPPLLLGTPEQISERLKAIDSVKATCVARVIVAADRLQDFIDALQANVARRPGLQEQQAESLRDASDDTIAQE